MAYVTFDQARAWSRRRWVNRTAAETEIRKSASAPSSAHFDIFMSHSFRDAEVILGIRQQLESSGLSVYVDWIDDSQLDRSYVTTRTADTLRHRMKNCKFLLYATSKYSPNSKWMPWELGYFDGLKDDSKIGVLPVVDLPGDVFSGQEYLGLYQAYELLDFNLSGKNIGRIISPGRGIELRKQIIEASA